MNTNDVTCQICNESFSNIRTFLKHIRTIHNITDKEYYDIYKLEDGEDKCIIDGNQTTFISYSKGYHKYCSRSCINKSELHKESVKNTKLVRYNNASYNNPKAVSNSLKNRSQQDKLKFIQKVKQTKLDKYNDENYNNMNKHKETCMNKYGVNCVFQSDDVKEKINEKWLSKSKEEQQKIIQTRKDTINSKSDEEKRCIAQKHRDAYFNKSDEEKEQIKQKSVNTKRKNHSFNTSKLELICYEQLLSIYNDTIHTYKSNEYPFLCDFYIPSIDTYIELNFHWTHGGHLFNENDLNDLSILCKWKEKSKNSKYYKNAIITWTIRDVNKNNIAIKNKLNYLVFYNKNEFDKWINSI